MFINIRNKRGFTLIELLVVIAIIGTLASVILASLNSVRAKARDSKRIAEIKQLEVALEIYFTDENSYPPHDSGTRVASSLTELTPDYMSQLPLDPVEGDSSNGYRYARTGTDQYTLLVRFETDDHTSWCGLSQNGGFTGWVNASWYREITEDECN